MSLRSKTPEDDGTVYPLNSIERTQRLLGGLGRSTVYNMISAGELRALKLNSRSMVTGDSIRERISNLPPASIGAKAA